MDVDQLPEVLNGLPRILVLHCKNKVQECLVVHLTLAGLGIPVRLVLLENSVYEDVGQHAAAGEREMDYKTFLDFVLAMENKNSRQAIQYFWKLIDIHHKGCLDGFVINYFFRAIVRLLQKKKFDVASVDDVKDEIFDMVKSETPGIITMQDLISCRQGGTVLSMLIDAAAFWRYDNRESLMLEPDDDDIKF